MYTEVADANRVAPLRIDAAEFCRLLTSRRHLIRQDLPDEGLLGLLDREEGILYITDADSLLVNAAGHSLPVPGRTPTPR